MEQKSRMLPEQTGLGGHMQEPEYVVQKLKVKSAADESYGCTKKLV